MQYATKRSNYSVFVPDDSASPRDGLFHHISCLGPLARLDFEHFDVAGEIIFRVDGDASPISQQDEESRISTLAYALKKISNPIDAAEFIRCLNTICEGGDARYRQTAASHYYREMGEREVHLVLKEMALLAMQLEQLNSHEMIVREEEVLLFDCESTDGGSAAILAERVKRQKECQRSFFEEEVEAMTRIAQGRKKSTKFVHDDYADWANELEMGGASIEELDAAYETIEAMEQYDESGAIIVMSSYERTIACGKIDPELTEEDIPLSARYLVLELRRAFANGLALEVIWEDIQAQLEAIFPINGKTATGAKFYSHANREWQKLTRHVLETILADCQADFHLTALRTCKSYRQFHKAVRGATDTQQISQFMQRAYEARQTGELPLKHFTTLTTAAQLQRIRLKSARLSHTATELLREVESASNGKLRFMRWAMYGQNQPQHPIHCLPAQEAAHVWEAIKSKATQPHAMAA